VRIRRTEPRGNRLLRDAAPFRIPNIDYRPAFGIIPASVRSNRAQMNLHRVKAKMEPPETIEVEEMRTSCDGGGGALGHPLVYLNLGDGGSVDCPYCGRRFNLKEGATPSHAH